MSDLVELGAKVAYEGIVDHAALYIDSGERHGKLADLVDRRTLQDLCGKLADLAGLSIAVVDRDGTTLVGDCRSVRPPDDDRRSRQADAGDGAATRLACESDHSFLFAELRNELDVLGYLFVGPGGGSDQPEEKIAAGLGFLRTTIELLIQSSSKMHAAAEMTLRVQNETFRSDPRVRQQVEETLTASRALHSLC